MARFSMNEMTTYRWSFEEDVARYVEAGIDAIGVWRQKLSDFGEVKGVDLLAENGLAVSNLLWAGGFTGSDGRTYRESIVDAEEAISLAASMQAGCLIVYSGARNGHTHNHARRLICTALEELAAVADDMEVTLAVEPMHAGCAEQWTFLTDLDDTLDLIQKVGSPHVKLALDTYQMGHDRTIVDRLPELIDHVAIVHLGDGRQLPQGEQDRCPLGEGTVPLDEIVPALIDAGYDGDFDVELIGEEFETSSYWDLLEHSQRVFDDLVRPRPVGALGAKLKTD